MSLKGNKGEWSEIYALFKLLGSGMLEGGDSDLCKVIDNVYPIIKVIREEAGTTYEYKINKDIVIVSNSQRELLRVPVNVFVEQALYLLGQIKDNKKTFELRKTEAFMTKIHCYSIKADSRSKTDITIQIHDAKTNYDPILGFSVKSQLGNPSTLLNAGQTTNFIYELKEPLTENEIFEINSIDSRSKIKDRLSLLLQYGYKPVFKALNSLMFSNNLILIDSLLPEILAEIVYLFYTTELSTLSELVERLEQDNPIGYDVSGNHSFYEFKVKRFLTDVALGMMPSKLWDGLYNASGGYLVVKEDGEILCYHLYNRNEFESYLLANTKLETASSSRHEFGKVDIDDSKGQFFKLNLQIRFVK